ncbi:hypothetical protein H8356DRAFT_1349651 [Neocallimastix lanati (nom. inval.)]|jgi:hypothetical protein|nr:hypothetical protein H8356DRAFT_1349651 [Neocallimastix sp. JGI-2020a]
MQNFLISLAALRDSTKYALDFLSNQNFIVADIDSNNDTQIQNENLDCSQAFDVLKSLKRDVKTFTNTNFLTVEEDKENENNKEESKESEPANLDNLHSQLSMIMDSFNSDINILDNDVSNSKEPKLDIVLSHQETLKSIDIVNVNSQNKLNPPDKATSSNDKPIISNNNDNNIEGNQEIKNEVEMEITNTNTGESSNPKNKKNNDLYIVIDKPDSQNNDRKKSNAAKNFLLSNTMPQTPEIERIKSYVTDVDLNKLNNIEIIQLILDSLIQTCNELLQLRSDTLSDVLGAYPKSPLSETAVINNNSMQTIDNYSNSNENSKQTNNVNNTTENDKDINYSTNNSNNKESSSTSNNPGENNNNDNDNNTNNKNTSIPTSPISSPKPIRATTSTDSVNPLSKVDELENSKNYAKQKTPKELLKELECLIILIHSLYENDPNNNCSNSPTDNNTNSNKNSLDITRSKKHTESMSSILTSNTELNSVINAIDSLLKSSPRFNNQCVQITADSKKKFQLMGVMSVVDRMTRTRLNDQRASPKQLDHFNRLIELLNNSLVRQYEEQRFTISPDKEKKMELGRLQFLVEKSKNSRLSNQDWCSEKLIREKEIEDIFEQSKYQSLENQRFVVGPEKEKNMYFNSLLKQVNKLDSYRLSNQDAVIKRTKPTNDSIYSINSTESDSEIATKRKEGPIKRLRRFSKSIKS